MGSRKPSKKQKELDNAYKYVSFSGVATLLRSVFKKCVKTLIKMMQSKQNQL
jgi:hypothetical protein